MVACEFEFDGGHLIFRLERWSMAPRWDGLAHLTILFGSALAAPFGAVLALTSDCEAHFSVATEGGQVLGHSFRTF